MQKKGIAFLLCLTLLFLFSLPAFADAEDSARVIDGAGLLTSSEEQALEGMSRSLRDSYQMDVVILTVHSLGGKSAQDFADDYYDLNQYGVGSANSGVLFLLAMGEREWYISTCGDAIYALTDYGIQQIGESVVPYFSDGAYYDGFSRFMQKLEVYFSAYKTGSPIDGYADYSGSYYHGYQEYVAYDDRPSSPSLFVSAVAGLIAASITVLCMRSAMNTKRKQHGAVEYMRPGSFQMPVQRDMYLYSRVSKTRRQTDSGGGGGHHGGGSSVHHSSGGHSHGGGGGRF